MAILNFPKDLFETVVVEPSAPIGQITNTTYQQLAGFHIFLSLWRTDLFTNEQIRLSIDRTSRGDTINSAWFSLSDITTLGTNGNYWRGRIRFEFGRENIAASDTLDLTIETQNYTHSLSGTQIGVIQRYLNTSGAINYTLPDISDFRMYGYRTV